MNAVRRSEAVSEIEAARRGRSDNVGGEERAGIGTCPDMRNNEVEGLRSVAEALKPPVHEESPKVVRSEVVGVADRDAVADHHESHRLMIRVDGAVPGVGVRVLCRFRQRLMDACDVVALLSCDSQRLDCSAVVLRDLA